MTTLRLLKRSARVINFASRVDIDGEPTPALPRSSRFRTHDVEDVEFATPVVSTRHSRFGPDSAQDTDTLSDIA